MKIATDIRIGNMLKVDGKICKVTAQEMRGTGKFGKMVHLKLKSVEDGHVIEKSLRAEDKAEDIEVQHIKMQYLYREGAEFYFMNMTSFEQVSIPAKSVGKQEVFLKENLEIDVVFAENRALTIDFPKVVELKVANSSPPTKGGGDSTYKQVELENGLLILVPQFIKQGDRVRVNADDLSYAERVSAKSLKPS